MLHRYIDDIEGFSNAFAAVMASPALVERRPESEGELARYSTREMVEVEHAMAARASRMGVTRSHGVYRHHVDRALSLQDDAIRARMARSNPEKAKPKNRAEHQGLMEAGRFR